MSDLDARFHPICDAMTAACEPFDMTTGEQLYLLTVLLLGVVEDVPDDFRDDFRRVITDALLVPSQRIDTRLRRLLLDGALR